MKRDKESFDKSKQIFVVIDLHPLQWHVTIRTEDVELSTGSIPGNWESLRNILDRHPGYKKEAVYEAGYFGFLASPAFLGYVSTFHDRLVQNKFLGNAWESNIRLTMVYGPYSSSQISQWTPFSIDVLPSPRLYSIFVLDSMNRELVSVTE